MKTNNHKIWSVALTMALGILMVACSEDEIQDTKMSRKLHLVMGTQNITDVTDLTRTLPDGYDTYSAHYGSSTLPTQKGIQAFMVASDDPDNPSNNSLFSFAFSTDDISSLPYSWWSSIDAIKDQNKTYYLYGFMPSVAASKVGTEPKESIKHLPNSTDYADGAVLTINGINAITPHDVCVIVGVKRYTPAVNEKLPTIDHINVDMTTRLGKFDIFDNNNPPVEKNYAYLLVDHIFCSFKFNLKIDEQYSKLRTIKVKTMQLKASTDGSLAHLIKKVKATITLQSTNGTTSPLATANSIVITTAETGEPVPAMLYDYNTAENNKPLELTTTDQALRGYLAPAAIGNDGIEKFVLVTTYDVYDRKGNLIRAGETATNTFAPKTLNPALRPGEEFTFNIAVTPTYLYMLSEPDLDSPTFTISNN